MRQCETIRGSILRRLREDDRSIYWLSRHKRLTCNERTAWNWLKGVRDGINVRALDEMCDVMGLRVRNEGRGGNRKAK